MEMKNKDRVLSNERTVNHQNKNKLLYFFALFGVIIIAANLRAPLTAVGPVVAEISNELGLTSLWAGMITTIPLIAFALLSGFIPRLSKNTKMETVLFYSLLVLTLGLFIRQLGFVSTLFIGAALVGVAITVGNVLMPAYIKNNFPTNVGTVTGVYSVAMNLTAALAAGYSINLGELTNYGWKGSLGIWIILSLIACLVWLPLIRSPKVRNLKEANTENHTNLGTKIYRSKLAWAVTLFMGLQSLLYYCLVAWLPQVMQTWGMESEKSGWILSYVQFAQLPMTFLGAVIASKMKNQKPLAAVVGILFIVGLLGILIFKTDYIILWCICIGTASGLAFSLSMLFFVLRTSRTQHAAELSAMAQSFGYLIAAFGPPIFGALFDRFNSWVPSLALLLVLSFILLIAGLISGQSKTIEN